MTLNELKAAVPGLVWQIRFNRYVGTPDGMHPSDAPISVHVRRDGRVARVGGFMQRNSSDVPLMDGLAADVIALMEAAADDADDEAKAWQQSAAQMRAALGPAEVPR